MRYAHVVLGLPVDRPFDYSLPEEMASVCLPGCRVWVNFRGRREVGYVVDVADHSSFPSVKPVLGLIDNQPLLSPSLLTLTSGLSAYYCCSWGEMIEAALPETLRKGRKVEQIPPPVPCVSQGAGVKVVRCPDVSLRWSTYAELIGPVLLRGDRCLILLPDTGAIARVRSLLQERFPAAAVGISYRKQPDEAGEWQKIRRGEYKIVVGTRSAVFAPLPCLGLIIVDDEQDHGYKQDQVPHYHARVAALQRGRTEGASVVLGSAAPSLESIMLVKEGNAELIDEKLSSYPSIRPVDITRLPFGSKSKVYLSKYLQDSVISTLAARGKVLVFLNRRGFATAAGCSTCGKTLKCPKCSTNLVYYYNTQRLACNFCAFHMAVPRLCPECGSGYIKFSGAGTEKVESELARLFPSARLKMVSREEPLDPGQADIFVATQSVLSHPGMRFDLTAVLNLDNSLNHADFRSTEKAFGLLTGLASMTVGTLVVQTSVPGHYAVHAVEKDDAGGFYKKEMSLRKQLGFPPFGHFALVKCRGVDEDKVRQAAEGLFTGLSGSKKRGMEVISVNPAQPPRLRGKYHWEILLSAADPLKLSVFIKNFLTDFRRSGIIVTVDVDPL